MNLKEDAYMDQACDFCFKLQDFSLRCLPELKQTCDMRTK